MEIRGAFSKVNLGWLSLVQLFTLLCLVAIVSKLATVLVRRRYLLSDFEAFPGPPSHWLVGNILQFKGDGTALGVMVKWGEQFPYAYPLWVGPSFCILIIHHPDYAKTILSTPEPKDDLVYGFLEAWIGNGLLVSKGQTWFRHRRLLTPGFHYNVLRSYTKLMADSANIMLDKWEKYGNGDQSLELFEHVSLMTLDIILKCACSFNSECQTEGGRNAYIDAVLELSELVDKRFWMFPYHSDLIFYLSPDGFRNRKACEVAHRHTEKIIRERKRTLNKEGDVDRMQTKRNLDFLDILLLSKDEKQPSLSDDDIRAEVDTFMFEGHDTTASGLTFILYNLACHPEHQRMCREEIMQVLDGKETFEWYSRLTERDHMEFKPAQD